MKPGKLALLAILVAGCALFGFATTHQNSHHTNFKYHLWKLRLLSFEKARPMEHLWVDRDFRQGFNGCSVEEIKKWFPINNNPNKINEHQRNILEYYYSDKKYEVYWLDGDYQISFDFENGKLKDIMLHKG
jgi:hypothetical protein